MSKTDTYATKDMKGKIESTEEGRQRQEDHGKTRIEHSFYCNWKTRLPMLVFNTYSPLGRMIF